MDSPVVIRGTFTNKVFVSIDPLPEAEGPAELIVHARHQQRLDIPSTTPSARRHSLEPGTTSTHCSRKSGLPGVI